METISRHSTLVENHENQLTNEIALIQITSRTIPFSREDAGGGIVVYVSDITVSLRY